MRLSLKIAMRYLRSKKAHSAVNAISIVSVCGVAVATAAIVCVLSVYNGFSAVIASRLSLLDPDIAITATTGKAIFHADSVAAAAGATEGVALALPTVDDYALAIFYDYQMPVHVKGVPALYDSLTCIRSTIIAGDYQLSDGISEYTVMSAGAATALNVRPGYLKMVGLYAPRRTGNINLANPASAFRADSVFMAGVFLVDQKKYDTDMVYVSLPVARRLFDYTTEATQVEVRLREGHTAEAVMATLRRELGPSYTVRDRLMQEAEAFRMVNVEKWVTFLLLAFILVIATFNVIGSMSLLILEKRPGIGTLLSLGATQAQTRGIFVAESWLISLTGSAGGIVLGLGLCLLQQEFGLVTLSGGAATIVSAYPVEVKALDVLTVAALSGAVGLLTSAVTSLTLRRMMH